MVPGAAESRPLPHKKHAQWPPSRALSRCLFAPTIRRLHPDFPPAWHQKQLVQNIKTSYFRTPTPPAVLLIRWHLAHLCSRGRRRRRRGLSAARQPNSLPLAPAPGPSTRPRRRGAVQGSSGARRRFPEPGCPDERLCPALRSPGGNLARRCEVFPAPNSHAIRQLLGRLPGHEDPCGCRRTQTCVARSDT